VPITNDQRNRSTCGQCMKCIIQPSSYHSSNSLASNHHNSSSMYLKPLKTVTSTTTYNKRLLIDTDSSRRWSLNFDSLQNNNNSLISMSSAGSGYESLPPILSETESNNDNKFLVPPLPPPPPPPQPTQPTSDSRCRIYSSSNESNGQLDDSLSNYDNYCSLKSPVTSLNTSNSNCHFRNNRSLSCSPMSTTSKMNTESEIVFLQNEKFKEKFPKACKQMEENLSNFIEKNKDISQIDYFREPTEPAARFIHNQIIELANWCLEKSKQNQLTCAYFDEMTNSLEKLLVEATEKCVHVDSSVGSLRKFVKKFLLIVSRVARLLECLEFDPEEFCHLLNAAEAQARHVFINYTDIPKYIISKLGLNKKDPFEEFAASINSENISDSNKNEKSNDNDNNKLSCLNNNNQNKLSLINNNSNLSADISPKEEDFEQIKLISNGAYGAVYLVRYKNKNFDNNNDMEKQRFAMKKIKKDNLILRNQLQQVFNERDIMIFTDNPFVVALICTFETKKHLCMVMEYVEGGDVATLIKNMGPLPLDMARTYFAETTLAVEYLHNYGIIHRDLKPDNLLITSLGHIKLTDFGLSKVGLMNLTTNFYEGDYLKDHYCKEFNDKQICGTPQYIAPEVILRRSYGKTVDWWSMGIILYEFLTSFAPYNGNTPDELFQNVISDNVMWPDDEDELKIPDDAKDLINGLLTQDPLNRLGADGVIDIKKHVFFLHLDWDNLLRNKAQFIPDLDGPDDTTYFDTRSERYNHQDEDTNSDDDFYVKNNKSISTHLTKQSLNNKSINTTFNKLLDDSYNNNSNSLLLRQTNSYDTDTENELFASFSSCSSKFKICSNNNSISNSPILLNEYKQSNITSILPTITQQQQIETKNETETDKLKICMSNLNLDKSIQIEEASPLSSSLLTTLTNNKSNKVLTKKDHLINITSPTSTKETNQKSIIFNKSKNQQQPYSTEKLKLYKSSQSNAHSHSLSNSPTYCKLNQQQQQPAPNPVVLRASRQGLLNNENQRPKSCIIPNNHHNNSLVNTPPSSSSSKIQNYINKVANKKYNDSVINEMINLALKKPELIIPRNGRNFDFKFKSIRVYYDDTDFYSIQHIITDVEDKGQSYFAGLKVNHIITHVNDQIVCDIDYKPLVNLIYSNNPVRLRIVNIDETRIKSNGRKRCNNNKYANPSSTWNNKQSNNNNNQTFYSTNRLNDYSQLNAYNQRANTLLYTPAAMMDYLSITTNSNSNSNKQAIQQERKKKPNLLRKVSERRAQNLIPFLNNNNNNNNYCNNSNNQQFKRSSCFISNHLTSPTSASTWVRLSYFKFIFIYLNSFKN
jgi:microtubule-associated serine/threonine kinase